MATRTKTTGGVTAAPPVCKRKSCRNRLTAERAQMGAVFCSRKCKRRNSRERSPSFKRAQQRYRAQQPYPLFMRASVPGKRLKVVTDDKAQQQARQLMAGGCVGYQNAAGLIRDVGAPRDARDAGKLFFRVKLYREGTEARAAA